MKELTVVKRLALVALLTSGLAVGLSTSLQAQPDGNAVQEARQAIEVHEAVAAAGLAVESVRTIDGRCEVVLAPASAGRQAEADRIRDTIVARGPRAPIVVDNLQDALVVLQFEPNNESARALVRARYQTLRTAASQPR